MRAPEPKSESLKLISSEMIDAVGDFFSKLLDFNKSFPGGIWAGELPAPYLFWYRFRSLYSSFVVGLEPHQKSLVNLLAQWIEAHYGQEYEAANNRLREGYVSRNLMKYYIMPGDILVMKSKGQLQTCMAETWILDLNYGRSPDEDDNYNQKTFGVISTGSRIAWPWCYRITAWTYRYDGSFYKKPLSLTIDSKSRDQMMK